LEREQFRGCNIVERAVGWLKNLRRIAPIPESPATHFSAMTTIALVPRYATRYLSDTTWRQWFGASETRALDQPRDREGPPMGWANALANSSRQTPSFQGLKSGRLFRTIA
jgi:hypothetical protein